MFKCLINLVTTSSDKTSVDIPRELLEGKTTQFYIGTEVLQLIIFSYHAHVCMYTAGTYRYIYR